MTFVDAATGRVVDNQEAASRLIQAAADTATIFLASTLVCVALGIISGALLYWREPLQRLFAPRGNLLVADILAETTVHVLSSGERKAIISKFEDTPDQRVRQQLVQALVFTAIDIARERGIGISWDRLAALYPMPAPPPPGGVNNG